MTLKQCYEIFDGDYEGVLGRMRKETLVEKFALKFIDDPSFKTLQQGLAVQDREIAFRAAHTIKGVAQNLGFIGLYEPANQLTEILRQDEGGEKEVSSLMNQLETEYRRTVNAILAYREA